MIIDRFVRPNDQMCILGKHSWHVPRLFELSKDLKVMTIPLNHLNINVPYTNQTLRTLVGHMKAVEEADLSYPIILDEDGEIMDGRHRIMKALLSGAKTIKAIRFDVNPSPCRINNEE